MGDDGAKEEGEREAQAAKRRRRGIERKEEM